VSTERRQTLIFIVVCTDANFRIPASPRVLSSYNAVDTNGEKKKETKLSVAFAPAMATDRTSLLQSVIKTRSVLIGLPRIHRECGREKRGVRAADEVAARPSARRRRLTGDLFQ